MLYRQFLQACLPIVCHVIPYVAKVLISFVRVVSESRKPDGTPQSAWGILKSPDKVNKLREHDPTPAGRNHDLASAEKTDVMRYSRVSFRLDNEVFGGDEVEAEADREVEAITGTGGESPDADDEVG